MDKHSHHLQYSLLEGIVGYNHNLASPIQTVQKLDYSTLCLHFLGHLIKTFSAPVSKILEACAYLAPVSDVYVS